MTTHHLKTLPPYFQAVKAGLKTAELRKDDRGFTVGDVLILEEWDGAYTSRKLTRVVTHIVRGGEWLSEGYCMLSMGEIDTEIVWPELKTSTPMPARLGPVVIRPVWGIDED